MELMIGALLIPTFFALVYYCVGGYNLMIGFLIISVSWTVLSLVDAGISSLEFIAENSILQFGGDGGKGLVVILNKIYQAAPEGRGTTLVNVCWDTWFGRALMETGTISMLIRKAVELGEDRPIITIVFPNIVTASIFTAMMGAGSVIAIGVIVLPILMSLGIPKAIAMFIFMGSASAGTYLDPVLQLSRLCVFILPADQMSEFSFLWYVTHWGHYTLGISVATVSLLAGIYLKSGKRSHARVSRTPNAQPQKEAPMLALLLPIMPVVLKIALDFSVIGGFIIAGLVALFLCGRMKGSPKENYQLVNKLYYDGVVDTAPLIGFLLTLPMFNTCAIYVSPFFKEVMGGIMPTSEYVVCILFAASVFLGLFRGPFILFSRGAVTLGILPNVGHFLAPFLLCVFSIPTTTVNTGSCITQSWIAWGPVCTKVESKEFLELPTPFACLTSICLYILTVVVTTGLGAQWFLN